jgi:hypothetical protein
VKQKDKSPCTLEFLSCRRKTVHYSAAATSTSEPACLENGVSGSTSPPPKLLAIFPEVVVSVGSRIISVKPIGVTGGIEVFAPWMVALPDFMKRVDKIQSPHRFVNHLTSKPDGMLQSHQ